MNGYYKNKELLYQVIVTRDRWHADFIRNLRIPYVIPISNGQKNSNSNDNYNIDELRDNIDYNCHCNWYVNIHLTEYKFTDERSVKFEEFLHGAPLTIEGGIAVGIYFIDGFDGDKINVRLNNNSNNINSDMYDCSSSYFVKGGNLKIMHSVGEDYNQRSKYLPRNGDYFALSTLNKQVYTIETIEVIDKNKKHGEEDKKDNDEKDQKTDKEEETNKRCKNQVKEKEKENDNEIVNEMNSNEVIHSCTFLVFELIDPQCQTVNREINAQLNDKDMKMNLFIKLEYIVQYWIRIFFDNDINKMQMISDDCIDIIFDYLDVSLEKLKLQSDKLRKWRLRKSTDFARSLKIV